eukprot:scaffold7126_cov142-Skeletonema_menzelii.AAC.10
MFAVEDNSGACSPEKSAADCCYLARAKLILWRADGPTKHILLLKKLREPLHLRGKLIVVHKEGINFARRLVVTTVLTGNTYDEDVRCRAGGHPQSAIISRVPAVMGHGKLFFALLMAIHTMRTCGVELASSPIGHHDDLTAFLIWYGPIEKRR